MRPPGYEPGELPTAPLRDVTKTSVSLFVGAKVLLFVEICKFLCNFFPFSYIFLHFTWLFQIKVLLLHTTYAVCKKSITKIIEEDLMYVYIENKTVTS